MTTPQLTVFLILAATLVLFVWGRWRYDVVALTALTASVVLGVVAPADAFTGFADPAVITVAMVLVISRAVRQSGLIERLLEPLEGHLGRVEAQILLLGGLVAVLSAFINNVGALAAIMPIAVQVAQRQGTAASSLLMPLAAASLLGGLVTLIGTPPNVLIAAIRREVTGVEFQMFDFAPVGIILALAGLAYLLIGWRLLPRGRKGSGDQETPFRIEDYITEVRIAQRSKLDGKTIAELEELSKDVVRVLAFARGRRRWQVASRFRRLGVGDVLQVEADPKELERLLADNGLELVGKSEPPPKSATSAGKAEAPAGKAAADAAVEAGARHDAEEELEIAEAVITAQSPLIGATAQRFRLRERFAVNLLAVRRGGGRPSVRLDRLTLQPGDIVMLEGARGQLNDVLAELGCLPLATRELRLGRKPAVWQPPVLMLGAVLLVTAGILPAAMAFTAAVTCLLLLRVLTPDEAYAAISWPVIILLGALIPVTGALQTTGGTGLVAGWLAMATADAGPLTALAIVLGATLLVTPILNNAATVLLVAPIAAAYAQGQGIAVDPFLMAVAVGASCAFITPFGHQSNTLVMAPGGYRFLDYTWFGLPLTIMVFVLALLVIPLFWPFQP